MLILLLSAEHGYPVLTQHYPMPQRNLLYTGVTRGKHLVVLVGQKKAVTIAVRNASSRRRWSKLNEWLRRSGSWFPDLTPAQRPSHLTPGVSVSLGAMPS